ncbi:MAG TPA: hypothetical protein VGL70_14000 [Candidatus Binatia bacterium]|jgi:hypothetical protein
MSQIPSKSPLNFLHPSAALDLEDILKKTDNVERIAEAFRKYFQGNLFRATCPDDSGDPAQRMTEVLCRAVVEKLRRYFPKETSRDGSTLIRWHPEQTAVFLNQALGYLIDVWINDFGKRPADDPVVRCERLLPRIAKWPHLDMRGRPQHGNVFQLIYLATYEDVMKCLTEYPRKSRGRFPHDDRDRRRKFLATIFTELPQVPGRKGRCLFHPQSGELFLEATEQDIEIWIDLSRHALAMEITCRVVNKTLAADWQEGGLSPESLHRLLPRLRTLSHFIDGA